MALFAAVSHSPARADELDGSVGYLTVRSLSPGHLLRPNTLVAGIPDDEQGKLKVAVMMDWGNVWNYEPDSVIVDSEWIITSVRASYTIAGGLEGVLVLPFSVRTGGIFDSVIEDFHTAVGLTNEGREDFPRNHSVVDIRSESGRLFLDSESLGLGDVPVMLSWRLRGDRDTIGALHAGITLPTGDEAQLQGLGRPVVSAGLTVSRRVARSDFLHGGLSAGYCDKEQVAGVELRPENLSAMLCWEHRVGSRSSLLAQYSWSSPVAKDYFEFSEAAHELNIGYKRRVAQNAMFELSLTENLFILNNTTDVAVHMGWLYAF